MWRVKFFPERWKSKVMRCIESSLQSLAVLKRLIASCVWMPAFARLETKWHQLYYTVHQNPLTNIILSESQAEDLFAWRQRQGNRQRYNSVRVLSVYNRASCCRYHPSKLTQNLSIYHLLFKLLRTQGSPKNPHLCQCSRQKVQACDPEVWHLQTAPYSRFVQCSRFMR